MNLVITLLTILEVIVCLLLSLLVLMQRPRQEGLGAAFGSIAAVLASAGTIFMIVARRTRASSGPQA